MGKELLSFFRTRVSRACKLAFTSTFIVSLLIHLYKFANTLPNHDSLYNYYSSQNMVGSGRWALSLACGISSYFDLPWINGLMCCLAIALTVSVIVALFEIDNPVLIVLIGALFAAAPATTETFFFLFTADGYMFAMLLSALAVYYSRIDEQRPSRWIISAICMCVSCAIYQAYVSFSLVLAICNFIVILLKNRYQKADCMKWILRQAIICIVSLAAYYAIWKVCLYISGTAANNYQGISDVDKWNVGLLKHGLVASMASVVQYFLQWDVISNGFSLYSVLSIIFVIIMGIGFLIALIASKILKRGWATVLLIVCLLAIIPFSCIWHFVSDSVVYRPMMLQCISLLFVLTAILYETWGSPRLKNLVALFLTIIVFNNAIMANISYFYMNLCYERTFAEGAEMMIDIHDLMDEYECEDIAVVGNRLTDLTLEFFDTETGKIAPAGRVYIFSGLLETSMLIDGDHVVSFLQATYGLELNSVTRLKHAEISSLPEVEAMGCWPAGDSVAVIDGTVVIKLSNIEEVA